MKILNAIPVVVCLFLTFSLSAQSPINVNKSTSANDNRSAPPCQTDLKDCDGEEGQNMTTLSTLNISTSPNSNQTLVEFEVNQPNAILSIEARSITQLGKRTQLITLQKFDLGVHKLVFENEQLPEGISQIIVTDGRQVRVGKTIRL